MLVISPVAPWPLVEGHRKRVDFMLRCLESLGYEVSFVLLGWDGMIRSPGFDAVLDACRARFRDFHFVAAPPEVGRPPIGDHHALDEWWSPSFDPFLDWISRWKTFDAVIVNYVFMSKALEHFDIRTLKILETHDRFAERQTLFRDNGLDPQFFWTTDAEEAKGLNRADIVVAIKESEARAFADASGHPGIVTLPYRESTVHLPDREAGLPARLRFGYFASSNIINASNFETFFATIMRIWPDWSDSIDLVLAGSICRVLDPAAMPGVTMLGFVETPAEFYARTDVVVIPQSFSSGLKIKTAEALAHGLPVIAHAHAFDGFPVADPRQACADFAEMVGHMRALSREPEHCVTLAEATVASSGRLTEEIDEALRFLRSEIEDVAWALIVSGETYLACPAYAELVEQWAQALKSGQGRGRAVVLWDDADAPDRLSGLRARLAVTHVPRGDAAPIEASHKLYFCEPEAGGGSDAHAVPAAVALDRHIRGLPPKLDVAPSRPVLDQDDPSAGTLGEDVGLFRWPPFVEGLVQRTGLLILGRDLDTDLRLTLDAAFADFDRLEIDDHAALDGVLRTMPRTTWETIAFTGEGIREPLSLTLGLHRALGARILDLDRVAVASTAHAWNPANLTPKGGRTHRAAGLIAFEQQILS